LLDRIVSVLLKLRETVQVGNCYGPAPRRVSMAKLEVGPATSLF
jgi:hypothetical protein